MTAYQLKRVAAGHYRTTSVSGRAFTIEWTKDGGQAGYWNIIEYLNGDMPSWVTTTPTLRAARAYLRTQS